MSLRFRRLLPRLGGLLTVLLLAACAARVRAQDPNPVPLQVKQPVSVILDTDIGPDVDDVGCVAILNALADRGEARILGMNCCTSSPWGAPCLEALNTYYGRPDIPVGTLKKSGFLPQSEYNRQIAERFPHRLQRGEDAPDATEVYRRLLGKQRDHNAVVIATGPLPNLQRLLNSGPDRWSPLTGRDLVRRKVILLSIMGGHYPDGKEWNFEQDAPAAAQVLRDWPSPIVCSGAEIGARIFTGRRLHTETPPENPVHAAYALFPGVDKDRESWDETAVLAAVRGPGSHWTVQNGGTITVDPKTGASHWSAANPGQHAYLVERDAPEVVKRAIEDLMVARPGKGRWVIGSWGRWVVG